MRSKVAYLESKVDMLEAELSYLNDLLVRCGFPEGISTLKSTVEELLAEDNAEWEQHQEGSAG
ncbi:MAG: hypothetical protein KGZ39_02170 [Simkania sp.]|nr:hypothetical protein [Simkania sp.]